jgi:hypothetical protein
MPALLPAIVAQTAVAAPVAAATIAPAAVATTTTAAAQTAALELAKQKAIEASMQQMAAQGAKQATAEAVKQQVGQQIGQQVAQQGIAQAGQQTGVEAMKQGIFSANPAGMPPTAGAPITPVNPATPLNPAGINPVTPAGEFNPAYAEQLGQQNAQRLASEGFRNAPPGQAQQLIAGDNVAPIATQPGSNMANAGFSKNYLTSPYDLTSGASNGLTTQPGMADALAGGTSIPTAGTPLTSPITPTSVKTGLNVTPDMAAKFGTAPENPLVKGAKAAFEWMGNNKLETGLGLMTAGQYMNEPEEEDKDKYKNTVDMAEFQPSAPTQRPFTRSYEYQKYAANGGLMKYAVGGSVEQMAAMNAVGANTGYPQAGLQTPMYSNPAMQRPEATNVIAPSADAGVNAYTGEPRFAEGGLSEAERREYGLSTKAQRASRNLTKSYEEMEEARQKEAMRLFGERSDPGIVPRSRTQMMSSPFSAAMAEHARLGKKSKVPVVEMPKTNLGDIDNYMDIPIEAAQGGIMYGLGGYSDGGRLLKGPGDGVSDSIPAVIGKRQPARLADGEFVIPARIVSELGNGSTEAGARKLYAMMERVQRTRKKSIGKKKVAVNSKADKHLPA